MCIRDSFNAWCGLTIGTATTNNGGTASNPQLHSKFSGTPGTIVNSGGILIQNVDGIVTMGDFVGIPNGEVGWWFDYQVPDVPASTIIAIDLTGLVIRDAFGNTMSVTYGGALEIHVTEPPCCPGDTDNDGDIDIDDYYRFLSDLSYALWLCIPPDCDIYPGNPITGFLWDPCLDLESDGDIDIDDYYKILGDLSYAYYLTGLNGPPVYLIAPGDPNTGFLWPCN